MTILFQEEFESRSQLGTNSLGRIYQGKSLDSDPFFYIKNPRA